MATAPLRKVVKRELFDSIDTAWVAIRDTLECGHHFQRNVSNKGSYQDYNPAARRRCDECAAS